jgi:hypothetical protein
VSFSVDVDAAGGVIVTGAPTVGAAAAKKAEIGTVGVLGLRAAILNF